MTLIATIALTLLGVFAFLGGLCHDRRIRAGFRSGTRLGSLAQIAFLTAGPGRTGETVVAAMIEREQLRLDGSGRLYRTPLAPVDALGVATAELVGVGAPTFPDVIRQLATTDAMAALAGDLAARGLVVDAARRRRGWWSVAAAEAAFAVGGLVLGVASTSWFVAAAVVLVSALGVVALICSWQPAGRTNAGYEAVRAAWADHGLMTGAAGAVAVGGLANHPDRETRVVFSRGRTTRRVHPGYGGGFFPAVAGLVSGRAAAVVRVAAADRGAVAADPAAADRNHGAADGVSCADPTGGRGR
ncbi:TIGR04222 domain-containing membrane protein [Amycolatopsis sp. NPDC049253]|uniref:TIGR04222 domain-containing membrane protein n=1 Tax=Amycolatopsis sp. NPDC049253 TaxID=3155274 RepID=UPI00341C71F2